MAMKLLSKDKKTNRVALDFPQQGEKITSPSYTIRVSAPESARKVEVAIDQGPWRACRKDGIHWWYDWDQYDDGEHEAITRIETQEGARFNSEAREFFVELPR
jgi:hypothetical protein